MTNKTIYDLAIGQVGPCLKKGHPSEHTLKSECWVELRRWLHDNPADYNKYVRACQQK